MSAETADLLIEIGCEELPPKSLLTLANAFASSIEEHLRESSFFADPDPEIFTTPRRIAVIFKDVPVKRNGGEVTGPPLNIAFDKNGSPTPAALAFAKKGGVTVEQLGEKNGKLSYKEQDCHLKELLINDILLDVLHRLPIAKRMRWGNHKREFVRPIHWIIVLLGKEVINDHVFDLTPDRITYGHRFHTPKAITINEPSEYAEKLRAAFVEPDFVARRGKIRAQIEAAAKNINGVVHIDEALLDEVTALVEWPIALTGQFDKQFLDVPHEALVSTMTGNQKYFPVFDNVGKLLPYFIFVTNIESKDPQQIIAGNEKVIRPRFSDAQFFFEQDKKIPLEQLVDRLKTVVFQKELGTLHDKSSRLMSLVNKTTKHMKYFPHVECEEAAKLCKIDLVTSMVSEFPELQGVMGKRYASHHGKSNDVSNAIEEHYLPRFANDKLPTSKISRILAVADRIDTLIGIFAINQLPTGDKDPFALRRAALGVLRILIDEDLSLDLRELFNGALDTLLVNRSNIKCDKNKVVELVIDFTLDRLQNIYQEQGFTTEEFLVTRAQNLANPIDFDAHIKAIHAVSQSPEIRALASANKRIANILAKAGSSFVKADVNEALLVENAEKMLFDKLALTQNKVSLLSASKSYEQIMLLLAELKTPVDAFFDSVMVNAEDVHIRNNRLNLLQALRDLFLSVADISLLSISK